jgi:hypothetical protein
MTFSLIESLAAISPEAAPILALAEGIPRVASIEDYFRLLSRADDLYVRVGALSRLIDLGQLDEDDWDDAQSLSRHGAIATRLQPYFTSIFEHDRAEAVIAGFASAPHASAAEGMRAAGTFDEVSAGRYAAQRFLETADPAHLIAASVGAEVEGGWTATLPWLVRALLLAPAIPQAAMSMLEKLSNASAFDLAEALIALLSAARLHPAVCALYAARVTALRGDAEAAQRKFAAIAEDKLPPATRNRLLQFRAEAADAQGQYMEAAALYTKMNAAAPVGEQPVTPATYMKQRELPAAARDLRLAPDLRGSHALMLGFPRSGTTLLENALSSHPEVATFEEVPGMTSCLLYWRRRDFATLTGDALRTVLESGRDRYYQELDRRTAEQKSVYVDKMPLYTQYADTLKTVFPDKKIIFSVRHPYDVVLSCFRQNFAVNGAMAHFQTFERACDFYHLVMQKWFTNYTLETGTVFYSRYDRLVTDFDTELTGILTFLGLEWHDAVRDFSENAARRRGRTPSYHKVRQGLGLGVQSAWRSYSFLFDRPEARKLRQWVEFFGY